MVEEKPKVVAMIGLKGVAEQFDVTPRCVQKWIRAGYFPKPRRVGRRILRWAIEDINTWIEAGCPRILEDKK